MMLRSALDRRLQRIWLERGPVAWCLAPLSLAYRGVAGLRRQLYQRGFLPRQHFELPVIVVGNISVGGTGKTPLVIEIVEFLRRRGYTPGVVSRGYRAQTRTWPTLVKPDSPAEWVGDEPVVIARRAGCPVMIDPVRGRGVQALRGLGCDCVVCDDGLQHYALAAGITIAVVDGKRGHGNGFCLPAGPLREPRKRLAAFDLVVCNGPECDAQTLNMVMQMDEPVSLTDRERRLKWAELEGQTVHAVAGIGHPQRFFDALRGLGLNVTEHAFGDHAAYRNTDFEFGDDTPILMTEKDAVKCAQLERENIWYVPVRAQPEQIFFQRLGELLLQRYDRPQAA